MICCDFEESIRSEGLGIYFEQVDLAANPKKIVSLFPEVVNSLSPELCLILHFG